MTTQFTVIDNAAAYDALLADHCLAKDVESIAGVPRHKRFEELTADEIAGLNDWFRTNGTVVLIRIDSVDLALHVLGAKEVDPALSPFNLERGSKKDDKKYYWCEANSHNRMIKTGNLGTLTKEGLIYDMVNRYYGLGPAAHIDAYGWILSLQHRLLAYIKGSDEMGDNLPAIELITIVGMPPQLAATLDRGAPKTKQDQEFIDREMFTLEFLTDSCGLEYVPENSEKLRNELAGYLVTVRNNLWSRMHGTGFHPSGANSPSTRQALALQSCFEEVGDGDALQRVITRVWSQSVGEDGKKKVWTKYVSVPMLTTAIVLASNADSEPWTHGSPLTVDDSVYTKVMDAIGVISDKGDEGLSSFIREVVALRGAPKKPSGIDRWVFWGLVGAVSCLLDDTYDTTHNYIPNVTKALEKKVKDKKISYPIFGGVDIGPKTKEIESDE